MKKKLILGINGSHNGSHCLLENNKIRVAIQEERLIGVKRMRVFGGKHSLGLSYCLDEANIKASDLSMIVIANQCYSQSIENDLWLNPDLRGLSEVPKKVVSHHLAHAASVYATSGYSNAAILVADGLGSPVNDLGIESKSVLVDINEDSSEHLSLFRAHDNKIIPLEIHTTKHWLIKNNSTMWEFYTLGGMFSAVSQQIFGDENEAGKVMGLAPYGKANISIDEFLRVKYNKIIFTNIVQNRFQFSARWPSHEKTYCDLAASAQHALEYALLHCTTQLHRLTQEDKLCFSGGIALNSVANQRLALESGFQDLYIIPSAEDSGVAVGAAYLGLWELGGKKPRQQIRTDSFGRNASTQDIEEALSSVPDITAKKPDNVLNEVAERLNQGQIGGWFQGGSELGPRALGQRSIICSPARKNAKDNLNATVKYREAFRPFAPSVLAEYATEWFNFGQSSSKSPFMLRVIPFRENRYTQVPAVVHINGTGRVQTLTKSDNGLFYDLVSLFYKKTNIPILLNTSMNIRGEPIVETCTDALWCLLGTGLDFCVVHDQLVTKNDAFKSILDYIPSVIAEKYTLTMSTSNGAIESSLQREDSIKVYVLTPWGKTTIQLEMRLMPLLSKINGKLNGYLLRELLNDSPTSSTILQDLLLLRRMHIVEFNKA